MFHVWTFFLLLNAFYGGALTMFFTSKPALPFTTVRQGLGDEDWKMIMVDGMQGSNSVHFMTICRVTFEHSVQGDTSIRGQTLDSGPEWLLYWP